MYFHTFVFALVLASGIGSPIFEYNAQSEFDRLNRLMVAFLKWVGPVLNSGPQDRNMLSRDMKNSTFEIPALDVKLHMSYLTFEKIEEAKTEVGQYKLDPKTLASQFRVTIPKIGETYKYKLEGTILHHKVKGEGRLTWSSSKPSVSVSDLKFHDNPHNLQISSVKIEPKIDDFHITFSGLHVDGMTLTELEHVLQAKVGKLVEEIFNDYLEANISKMEAHVNGLLKGHSLEDLVKWLKKHTKKHLINYF